MVLAYTNFNTITVIFTVASTCGLLAALWSLRESWLDREALHASGSDDAARATVNTSAIGQELLRIAVHVTFVVIGCLAMFVNPVTLGATFGKALGYAFGLTPALLGIASLFALYMRRRLSALISNGRKP